MLPTLTFGVFVFARDVFEVASGSQMNARGRTLNTAILEAIFGEKSPVFKDFQLVSQVGGKILAVPHLNL